MPLDNTADTHGRFWNVGSAVRTVMDGSWTMRPPTTSEQKVIAVARPGKRAWADKEAGMPDWDEFTLQILDALRRFVQGDAEPYRNLWSHRDDVTIFGGWGAYEQGWAAVEPRLDWAASRYSEGWLDRENLQKGVGPDIAYSVDIERGGGRFDNAPEVREAPLRVTHVFRREEGRWRIVHRHADFLQPRQEPR